MAEYEGASNVNKEALKKIPHEWITKAEAIGHIMAVMECSKEEAEAIFDEFKEMSPSSVMSVWPS